MNKVFKKRLNCIYLITIFILIFFIGLQFNLLMFTNTNNQNINKINEEKIKIINNYMNSQIETMELYRKLEDVNVFIVNSTQGVQGSGVVFKMNDNFYILSAGHMAENITDDLYILDHDKKVCNLLIMKHDFLMNDQSNIIYNDLILLCPQEQNIVFDNYVELAEREPIKGEDLIIVGNPAGLEDFITDARVQYYLRGFMYVSGTSYFGNSGGGIYTKTGKLVGIVSHVQDYRQKPWDLQFNVHGMVRLDTIKQFLEEYNNG